MNNYSDDFKGMWFPRNLWLDRSISLIEKGILVVVKNLDKSDDHCWATNNYLADFFQCSQSTIKRAIAHLKQLGYIEEAEWGKIGVCRKLKVIIDIETYPGQNEPGSKWTQLKMTQGVGQNEPGGGSKWTGYPGQNDHLIIYNNSIYNNIDNNIDSSQKNFCSPTACESGVETGLVWGVDKKSKRKSQKQKRYEEVMTSPEFTATLCHGIESESAKQELISLWGEYVELRCSKDYKAFTNWAVKRNLNVLDWTSLEERKEIISKSVTKWRTGLFPLNDYDKKRLVTKEANVEWSDERLYNSILKMNCQEREELIPQGTLHKYLMELCEQYWKDKIRDIYYNRVRPEIKSIYGIKRDWVSH